MKTVVICGSQRYNDEIAQFAARLRKLGVPQVFVPNFKYLRKSVIALEEKDRFKSKSYKKQIPALVLEHFDRIRKADICFFYNKNGYLGINSTLELGFAHAKDMLIYSLEPEIDVNEGGELCRDILFTEIVKTPEELIKKLV